jgi:uncharacterized protein
LTGIITTLPDLGWMLRPLIEIPGVRHAVVVSEDGLRLGHDSAQRLTGPVSSLSLAEAESLSAACAAMNMTGRSTASLLFGPGAGVRQLMLESEHGFVLFTHTGVGAHLGVATGTDADVGLVAQQMQLLVAKIGDQLNSRPRDPVADSS